MNKLMRLAEKRGVWGLAGTKITSDCADAPADVRGEPRAGTWSTLKYMWQLCYRARGETPGLLFTRLKVAHFSKKTNKQTFFNAWRKEKTYIKCLHFTKCFTAFLLVFFPVHVYPTSATIQQDQPNNHMIYRPNIMQNSPEPCPRSTQFSSFFCSSFLKMFPKTVHHIIHLWWEQGHRCYTGTVSYNTPNQVFVPPKHTSFLSSPSKASDLCCCFFWKLKLWKGE